MAKILGGLQQITFSIKVELWVERGCDKIPFPFFLFEISLHTKNQLPGLHGSGLNVCLVRCVVWDNQFICKARLKLMFSWAMTINNWESNWQLKVLNSPI